ncbi:hypothetical protein FN846DRAFT_123355 [Sphaerosporella brunnea]|uniref:Uncharacterized protein n=1 Tax=Sphaerosporella brunnea TaxID=1250544 RepID=A0A5J5ERR4_9PEZI|nr:hypothetical protein FN846DRAFT_123355 [Sphaerosporella brunnea]
MTSAIRFVLNIFSSAASRVTQISTMLRTHLRPATRLLLLRRFKSTSQPAATSPAKPNTPEPNEPNAPEYEPIHHPVATTSTAPITETHEVEDRKGLCIQIQYRKNASSKTPTILRLPHVDDAPPAPESAIVIKPLWGVEKLSEPPSEDPLEVRPTPFPSVLHDVIASLHAVRALFPDSQTGLLAAGYPGAWALSAALSEGRAHVSAVAVDAPVVDLISEGRAKYDTFLQRWLFSSKIRQLYGDDPALYWTDKFASPLMFFVTSGWKFPNIRDRYGSNIPCGAMLPSEQEDRRALMWPPRDFVPGYGWCISGQGIPADAKFPPRILLTLGTGPQAGARALFVHYARRRYTGLLQKQVEVGVLKVGLHRTVLGEWLEQTLRGNLETGEILERGSVDQVLQQRQQGTLRSIIGGSLELDENDVDLGTEATTQIMPEVKEQEEETETIPSVEELLRMDSIKGNTKISRLLAENAAPDEDVEMWRETVEKFQSKLSSPSHPPSSFTPSKPSSPPPPALSTALKRRPPPSTPPPASFTPSKPSSPPPPSSSTALKRRPPPSTPPPALSTALKRRSPPSTPPPASFTPSKPSSPPPPSSSTALKRRPPPSTPPPALSTALKRRPPPSTPPPASFTPSKPSSPPPPSSSTALKRRPPPSTPPPALSIETSFFSPWSKMDRKA